ncbi:MAG: esterase-like activity of phytase family protein, partial [Cytophagaceae bacterium]|nr:esterase-like activity of phytase family protein [Cytophagaceae bacterium]
MKRNLTTMLLCFCGLSLLQTQGVAQITLMQDYTNNNSAAIGTFQGINFREGGFSSLYPIANTNGKEFWTISDRGVNVDAASANLPACRPTYDKLYGFANYAPKIHRIRLNGDSIQILQTITMKRPAGTGATGLLNPTNYGSTALEQVSTDTVTNCANFAGKIAAKDIWGIDSEGLVVDKDGNFWISEEGGPTIWKLNPNGVVVKRFTPYANLSGAQAEDLQIDTVFKYRKNNRGFESLAMTPNGKIYALIQSPLLFPNQTIGEGTAIHRMIEIDPVTNTTRVLIYLNEGLTFGTGGDQVRYKDWKVGDMAAINNNEFLVIESGTRGVTDVKRIYKINISAATAVTSANYSSTSVEGLVNAANLATNNITPVTKTLFLDLKANGWPLTLDKSEGIAIINDSTIAIGNDNDYGQSSPTANGIATATGTKSHILKYGLKGSNKIANFQAVATSLIYGETGPSTAKSPYLQPSVAGAKVTSILTTGDAVGGYRMCGTPDGLGAFDNNNGTFTLLMNHELRVTEGVTRAHGAIGAFVSKWIINKSNLSVVSGEDLIKNLKLWNGTGYTTYNSTNATSLSILGRFCSADLAPVSAFYNSVTGKGSQERIFMNGEESSVEGRVFGHIASGINSGTSYELPRLGKLNIENAVASSASGDKTVVAVLDDATPGQVYFYIGTKTTSGKEVDKAGLTNGKLYGPAVNGLTTESNASVPTPGKAFTMVDLGNVENITGASLNTNSNNNGVTTFIRPEDGAWDPSKPNDFYFATTASFTEPSRLWRLRFTDVTNPELGGTITAVLDGTEGQINLDNICIDNQGHVLLVEDVGNNAHIGKIFQYTTATDAFKEIGHHDETRFLTGGANFLTQDEEAS